MTNMTVSEMVPDTQNAAHDPRYWCLPPQRDSPNAVVGEPNKGKFTLYLVTQGQVVGTWRNWTVAKAMITGFSGASHRGHRSYEACVVEWQQHCALGVHPHPADPALVGADGTGSGPEDKLAAAKVPSWKGKAVDPALQAEMKKYCMPNLPKAGPSRDDADDQGPHPARYSAIWGGRIVFCSRYEARCAFVAAEERGLEPQLLSSDNFTESQDFAEALESAGGPSSTSETQISEERDLYAIPLGEYRPAVVERVAEKKQKKRKKGEEKKKRGKVSWVWGTKLRFFEVRKDKWRAAVDTNQTGGFYTTMAKLYTRKYGYHIADNEDLAEDIADPPEEAANVVVNERLTPEEAETRSKHHAALRLRIGAWYRAQYGNLLEEDKETFVGLFTGNLDGTPPRPQRPQLIQYYSRKFYDSRVRVRFEARMAGIVRRAAFADDDMPAVLKIRNEVTKEVWEEECEAFQEDVKASLEKEYQASLTAWKTSLADSPTKTPEEMNATLHNAAFYLQPYVDAIQERFGMCASVFLAGPIGARGGAIGVRSVHAGKTRGAVPMNWPEFDVQGFAAAEASMVTFAREHFTEADCHARAIDGTVENDRSSWRKDPGATVAQEPAQTVAQEPGAPAAATAGTAPEVQGGEEEGTSNGSGVGGDGDKAAPGGDKDGVDGGEGGAEECGGIGNNGERDGGEVERTREELKAEKRRADAMWKRKDRPQWTPELTRAHAGFMRGKKWGIAWASCVKQFYDFERSHGYHGNPISTKDRPEIVKTWLAKGRPWDVVQELGNLGSRGVEDSFVDSWWGWWIAMQPKNRKVRDGVLDEASDHHRWYVLAKVGGRNGLIQLMAMLLWWGDRVGDKGEGSDFSQWVAAVEDVTEVLMQLQDVREEDDPHSAVNRRTPPLPNKRNRSPADEEEVDESAAPKEKKKRVAKAPKTTTTKNAPEAVPSFGAATGRAGYIDAPT
ncbi:hypothetical protein C8J57DRAFT_1531831 [Mycena rebaudengoi]|nr:hypothetical protein C8J57DRAFT_1531831 [Mycena rebaudengoi]